jgi:hypothetical protein
VSWLGSYVTGVVIFGFGMGITFGWGGVLVAGGIIIMIGGFGEFILIKTSLIVVDKPSPQENADG